MKGKYYTLNFALSNRILDENYKDVFEPMCTFTTLSSGLPTGWAYNLTLHMSSIWHVKELSVNRHILLNHISDDQNITVELCVKTYDTQNFTVAGLGFPSK